MIAQDADIAALYRTRRAAVDEKMLLGRVMELVQSCEGDWWTAAEADAVFGRIAQPQADLILMERFLAESFNGSVHQYFTNSSGTMAPQLRDALRRAGLQAQAASLQAGMDLLSQPYPRDTDQRRIEIDGFDEEKNNRLYDLTEQALDGTIEAAMITLAKNADLWPR